VLRPRSPGGLCFEVIAPEQSTQSADSDSAAREESTQPPQIVELDEPEVVAEPPPGQRGPELRPDILSFRLVIFGGRLGP
jgi:hypothetical protein